MGMEEERAERVEQALRWLAQCLGKLDEVDEILDPTPEYD